MKKSTLTKALNDLSLWGGFMWVKAGLHKDKARFIETLKELW